MQEKLNILEEYKKIVLKELRNIDTKKISKKWKILYVAGYIGMMVITTILFYPNNMMLALLLTILYGTGTPALQTVLDNNKRKKLRKELCAINKEIETIEKEIINQTLTEERLKKDIPITSYQQFKSVEEKILEELTPAERDRYLRENENFFMGEEYDETSEDVIDDILFDDNKKSKTRKRKKGCIIFSGCK